METFSKSSRRFLHREGRQQDRSTIHFLPGKASAHRSSSSIRISQTSLLGAALRDCTISSESAGGGWPLRSSGAALTLLLKIQRVSQFSSMPRVEEEQEWPDGGSALSPNRGDELVIG